MNAVDTNILIYACDKRDPAKQSRALDLIAQTQDCVLLRQVACEFVAASRKLVTQGFTPLDAWNRLAEFVEIMPLIAPTVGVLPFAQQLHLSSGVSFWDSMLLAACRDAGVTVLHSEDVPGGLIDGVRVVNPFA